MRGVILNVRRFANPPTERMGESRDEPVLYQEDEIGASEGGGGSNDAIRVFGICTAASACPINTLHGKGCAPPLEP